MVCNALTKSLLSRRIIIPSSWFVFLSLCSIVVADLHVQCDLHMPNKDGYQTCKDIRRWERKNKYKHLPIIALSANVLGDVYAKCVEAGFNSYVTKPVDFKELGVQMNKFLDPDIKGRDHDFMKNVKA